MTSPVNPSLYNQQYYQSSNYADYLERADRYKKTAYELTDLLRKLSLVEKDTFIYDYGCAVGFLLEGFKELGFTKVGGTDISEWAVAEGRRRGNQVSTSLPREQPGVFIALDVFEHMLDQDIQSVLMSLSSPRPLVVRIPSSTDGGKTFHLDISRADPTHINCKTKEQWIQFFRDMGYTTFLRLNLFTVYDTPGVTCLLIM